MIELIYGRSGSGKTEYCLDTACALAQSGVGEILFITPEQYNFTAEKKLLSRLGESGAKSVECFSFSSLSSELKRICGADALPLLSKGARAVLMKKAVELVRGELSVFNSKTSTLSFITAMTDIYEEMRSCEKTWQDIKRAGEAVDKKPLSSKLCDISAVMKKYEELLSNSYFDPADELSRLYSRLCETRYFSGKTVIIDGFNGFVANEFKIVELILSQAQNVYITLACDGDSIDDEHGLFGYINKTAASVVKAAREIGKPLGTVLLRENKRAANIDIKRAQENIYSKAPQSFGDAPENICVYSGESVADECDFAALTIKKLLRAGAKAGDIAVICRDMEKYSGELSFAFKKYEVPFFDDERQSVSTQPVSAFVRYLFRCVIYSYRSEDVLCLAKTGLTGLSREEINALENYAFVWDITGVRKWNAPFVNAPAGFKGTLDESDKRQLERLNSSREYLISRLNDFKKAVSGANARQISAAVYNALISFSADKKLRLLARELNSYGRNVLANEQNRVWDLLMEMLTELAAVCGEEQISAADYFELFTVMLQTEDLGVLPQGIDCVQFGAADRIRADSPSVVFILGATQGEFPKVFSGGGLLSDADRIILSENDFRLYSFGETLNIQERFFAYSAVCAARERLFVSYSRSGLNTSPSSLITSLISVFPNMRVLRRRDIEPQELIESRESAFELMSSVFEENTPLSASLKKFFERDGRYKAVERMFSNEDMRITNSDNAVSLFGRDMYLSASKIDDYFSCPFKYFCKFGLSARPLQKAQLGAMQTGNVIHYVLEHMLSEWEPEKLAECSESQIAVKVNKYLNEYFENELGDTSELNSRFKYQFMRISRILCSVVLQLAREFSQSSFVPAAFELKIDKDGDVQPPVIRLENGSVRIRGAVDRVDVLDKNGTRYIRVVDYKSGTKKFHLYDVLYGLNLQMFVYLFSLCADKSSRFSGVPAGVLYMHALRKIYDVESADARQEIEEKTKNDLCMFGVVLYDEKHDILDDMEHGVEGRYIPVTRNGDEVTGCFASLEGLGRIARKINSLVAEMGNRLHGGYIAQYPINNSDHDKTCEWCDYRDVCANRRALTKHEISSFTDKRVIEILESEENSDAEVD